MKWNFSLFTLFVVLGAVFISSCSTAPTHSRRRGIFDGMGNASGDRGSGSVLYTENVDLKDLKRVARNWRWPTDEVSVTSPFGPRGNRFHEGVDLRAHMGTPVHAAHDGVVIYSGAKVKGYGRMVVLQDLSGYLTVYAHHSKNLVRRGEHVKKGRIIAFSGKSGRASGPHLHFEVRNAESPVNPLQVLSGTKIAVSEATGIEYEESHDLVIEPGLGDEISKMVSLPQTPVP